MSESALSLVAWNFVIAAVLAVVVYAMGWIPLVKRRPALQHALWGLVLVKLVTPPLVPLPVLDAAQAERAIPHSESPAADIIDAGVEQPRFFEESRIENASEFDHGAQSTELHESWTVYPERVVPDVEAHEAFSPVPVADKLIDADGLNPDQATAKFSAWSALSPLFLAAWLAVALTLLGRSWVHLRRTSRLIRCAGEADDRLQRIVQTAVTRMGVGDVDVRVVDAQISPLIWIGWSNPCIVFPQRLVNRLSDDQLVCIACHELAHYVRRDQWFNTFALLVTAVCWWHPAAWLARREMSKAQELCCDEIVMSRCKVTRKSYLQTLLAALDLIQKESDPMLSLVSSFGGGRSIKSRFQALAGGKLIHHNGWWTYAAIIALFAALLCVPVRAEPTVEQDAPKAETKPLYLHWYKPAYRGDGSPAKHIRSVEIKPSREFDITFEDRELEGRKFQIKGRVDEEEGIFTADVTARWKSTEWFAGEFKLDEPCEGQLTAFSGAYFQTHVVLSRGRSAERFLGPMGAKKIDKDAPIPMDADDEAKLDDLKWGEVKRGLQAAIRGPERVRMNEVVSVMFYVRNVGDKRITVTFPEQPSVYVRPVGSRTTYGAGREGDEIATWELEPGAHIMIPSAPIQFLVEGDVGRKDALKSIRPRAHHWSAKLGAVGERWVTGPDGIAKKVLPVPGHWRGDLRAPPQPMEVLHEKVATVITAPGEFPDDHGLKPNFDPPRVKSADIELREGLVLMLDSAADQHWLHEYGRHSRSIYWGPLSGRQLEEFGLLPLLRESTKAYFERSVLSYQHQRIAALVSSSEPIARIGLECVSLLELPESGDLVTSELIRAIRDRRVEFKAMGLEKQMRKAVEVLAVHESPMPDDAKFHIVEDKKIPVSMPRIAWGPENDGLRAALLMPAEIAKGETAIARLFIRNVSSKDVRLTVSDRPGYDYATVTTDKGDSLRSERPFVVPPGFASGISPEYYPNQFTTNPPTTTLTKIILKPGAVYELKTITALCYNPPLDDGLGRPLNWNPKIDEPAVTFVRTAPTKALVTWQLQTANGSIHSEDLSKQLWPAKGGWTGVLTTAPTMVTLKASNE